MNICATLAVIIVFLVSLSGIISPFTGDWFDVGIATYCIAVSIWMLVLEIYLERRN